MVTAGRLTAWGLAVACLGCSDPCGEIAERLRECCARGPAELRESCEDEARALEEDGNTEACESTLEAGAFPGCGR